MTACKFMASFDDALFEIWPPGGASKQQTELNLFRFSFSPDSVTNVNNLKTLVI